MLERSARGVGRVRYDSGHLDMREWTDTGQTRTSLHIKFGTDIVRQRAYSCSMQFYVLRSMRGGS